MTEAAGRAPDILAVGAHTGDVEVTMGAIIAAQVRHGARATICHVTLGEGGHRTKGPAEYAPQRRREAEASARILGADLVVLPHADIGFAGGPDVVSALVDLIRERKPGVVLCHWPGSFHSGHSHSANCTLQAVECSPVARVNPGKEPWKVGAVWCPENWEDPFEFRPSLYVDVSDVVDTWEKSCLEHELFRGGALSFRYLDYYRGAMQAHGAVAGCRWAVAVASPWAFAPRKVAFLPQT